jgi:hypothetical protein
MKYFNTPLYRCHVKIFPTGFHFLPLLIRHNESHEIYQPEPYLGSVDKVNQWDAWLIGVRLFSHQNRVELRTSSSSCLVPLLRQMLRTSFLSDESLYHTWWSTRPHPAFKSVQYPSRDRINQEIWQIQGLLGLLLRHCVGKRWRAKRWQRGVRICFREGPNLIGRQFSNGSNIPLWLVKIKFYIYSF